MSAQRGEADLNEAISKILRYGVAVSSAVVATGLVMMLVAPPPGAPETLLGAVSADFGGPTLSPSALVAGISRGNAVSVIQLGILVLIATPITRVTGSVLLFLRERDTLYVGITLLVLGMLLFALLFVGPSEA